MKKTYKPSQIAMGFAPLALGACILLELTGSIQAAVLTFVGPGTNWNNSANWDPAQVPTAGDTVYISGYSVYGDAGMQFGTLNAYQATLTGTWSVPSGAVLNVNTDRGFLLHGTLVNSGTVKWTGITNGWSGSKQPLAHIVNQVGGLFELLNDQVMSWEAAGGNAFDIVFDNYGVVRKRNSTGTTQIWFWFNNEGTVEVQSGTLVFSGRSSGVLDVSAGATANLYVTFTLTPSHQFFGSGDTIISSAVQGNCTFASQHFWLRAATFSGNFQLTSVMDWESGQINTDGSLTVAPGGQLNLTTAGAKTLYGVLTNAGTIEWSGASDFNCYRQLPAHIVNLAGGVFDVQNNQTFNSPYMTGLPLAGFDNYGVFRKHIGTGTTTVGLTFNNAGIVEALSGTVYFTDGAYSMTGGGMSFGISSPTDFGQINVYGNAPLTGSLQAMLLNGYKPDAGASFPVLSFSSKSGAFTDTTGLNVGNGRYFEPVFTTTSLSLVAHATNNPAITSPTRLPNGTFQFSITDELPGVYQVLGSTNLQTWDPIATVTNNSGTLPFTDTGATNLWRRFYRAQLLPP